MNIMNRHSISGNNIEQVLQLQITNLQSNIVVMGTNLRVGPGTLEQLTTRTNNIAISLGAASGQYGLTTGSGNVILGINSGASCVTGSNNTSLGYNTSMYGASYIVGSIALGAGARITGYNQFMVAPNITQFNIPGLTTSTGTSAGTILEFNSAGNVLPMAGTYKTVASIDTAIAAINAPNFFWFTVSGATENISNPIPWGSIVYCNPANLDTTTGMWTCPTAGLWQFTFSIFCQNYGGYPGCNLFQNGTIVTLIEQASNSVQYLTSIGPFITPAKAGDTFQWKLQFVDDSSPVVVNGPGCFWQGLMIAPGAA